MAHLELVHLTELMELTSGKPEIKVGLIDGPVVMDHPDLQNKHIREIRGRLNASCTISNSVACRHGSYVAGILSAARSSAAPGICPHCTLLVRPIFTEIPPDNGRLPHAVPRELAVAILDCIKSRANVINLSISVEQASLSEQRELRDVLDYACSQHIIIVAAAGNHSNISSSVITNHPWVIPVVACDVRGKPMNSSNLGLTIGRQGLRAPGDHIMSLGSTGKPYTLSGTSAAAPFVTGTIALLMSMQLSRSAIEVKSAVTQKYEQWRTSIVPPLLDGWRAYQSIA